MVVRSFYDNYAYAANKKIHENSKYAVRTSRTKHFQAQTTYLSHLHVIFHNVRVSDTRTAVSMGWFWSNCTNGFFEKLRHIVLFNRIYCQINLRSIIMKFLYILPNIKNIEKSYWHLSFLVIEYWPRETIQFMFPSYIKLLTAPWGIMVSFLHDGISLYALILLL